MSKMQHSSALSGWSLLQQKKSWLGIRTQDLLTTKQVWKFSMSFNFWPSVKIALEQNAKKTQIFTSALLYNCKSNFYESKYFPPPFLWSAHRCMTEGNEVFFILTRWWFTSSKIIQTVLGRVGGEAPQNCKLRKQATNK